MVVPEMMVVPNTRDGTKCAGTALDVFSALQAEDHDETYAVVVSFEITYDTMEWE